MNFDAEQYLQINEEYLLGDIACRLPAYEELSPFFALECNLLFWNQEIHLVNEIIDCQTTQSMEGVKLTYQNEWTLYSPDLLQMSSS